jgi:hypothetical protein
MSGVRFTMSVDDGHPLDMRMAALLDRCGMRATFYLPMTNDEGAPVLDAVAMRELSQRFEAGSHTRSHRFLTTLAASDAWRQISEGKQMLEDCIGKPVKGFCYPGGRYQRIHLLQVRAMGFDYARTTQNLRIDTGTNVFEMPTSAQFYPHPVSVLLRNFLSQRDWLQRTAALRVVMTETDWLRRLHRLADLAIARDGVFHLWCHSLDIERLQLWQALESFLRRIGTDIPETQRVCNGQLLSSAPLPRAMADGDPVDDSMSDRL